MFTGSTSQRTNLYHRILRTYYFSFSKDFKITALAENEDGIDELPFWHGIQRKLFGLFCEKNYSIFNHAWNEKKYKAAGFKKKFAEKAAIVTKSKVSAKSVLFDKKLKQANELLRKAKLLQSWIFFQSILFNKEISVFSILAGLSLHSHTVMIFQPCFFNARIAFASLALLVFILCSHQSVLVLGTVKYLQLLWPCQKHPWMKMMVLYLGITMSGWPGSSLSCTR